MNRRGSTIVEASLVFPAVLCTLMGLIGIMMFLYEESASQSVLHQTVRNEAGRETGTYIGEEGSSQVACKTGFEGVFRVMDGEIVMTFDGSSVLLRSMQKKLTARLFLTDERKYTRFADFFTMEESNDIDEAQKFNE